jgi:hypothetical protein
MNFYINDTNRLLHVISPNNILAKLWLIRITNLIHKDCYTLWNFFE